MQRPPAGLGESRDALAVAGLNDLGIALLRQLPARDNCFFSPLSIASALSALLAGAQGATRGELVRLLRLPEEPSRPWEELLALTKRLTSRTIPDWQYDPQANDYVQVERRAFVLRTANALFVQDTYPILTTYQETLRSAFDAHVIPMDFGNAVLAASRVNQWVAAQTNQMIPQLVSPLVFSELTRMILANAVYFLAEWVDQFEEAHTRPEPFHLLPGAERRSVTVPMMRQTLQLPYLADQAAGLTAVSVPYRALALVVLLPAPGRFDGVEGSLTGDFVQRVVRRMEPRNVDLVLPRFSARSSLDLRGPLEALGLRDAFDERRADFRGISSDPEGLVVSDVVHEARIRVDEYGTEAAAATAVQVLAVGIGHEPETPIPFVADRPFWFAIYDHETGAMLFLGRLTNPAD